MTAIKKMVSFNPLHFQALEAVRKAQKLSRSSFIEKALENYPDFYQVLEGIREQVEPVEL